MYLWNSSLKISRTWIRKGYCTPTKVSLFISAVHSKYVQLRHIDFLLIYSGGVFELPMHDSTTSSLVHWSIRTFLDESAALLYIAHCNKVIGLILVKSLVISTYFVYVRYCGVKFWLLYQWRDLYYGHETFAASDNTR